jgi:putative ABC transport system permease protein
LRYAAPRFRHIAGLSLLALAAGCSRNEPSREPRAIIGFASPSSQLNLEEAREGFFKALQDSGVLRDSSVKIIERNAQGDIPTLSLIMSDFVQQKVTHIATVSSIATQSAIKSISDRPIIFGAVANPYIIGAGTSATEHRPNVTGAEIPLPVHDAVVVAHEAFPDVKAWGTLYDPGDPFAEFYLHEARDGAKEAGVKLIEAACTAPGDIIAGIQALMAQGAGGIMQIPSVMVGGGMPSIIATTRTAQVPLVVTSTSYKGAPVAYGISFFQNGYEEGLLMLRVLHGEDPGKIPFYKSTSRQLWVDPGAAHEFGLTISPSVVSRADSVIGGAVSPGPAVKGAPAITAPKPEKGNRELEFWLTAIAQGLAYAALAWGVYLTSRVLRFADISPDGAFPLGAAVSAALIVNGTDPLIATLAAIAAGMIAGYVTGLLHTRLGVKDLLAGILVMTALYSVNLHVMGRSNVSLLDTVTVVRDVHRLIPASVNWPDNTSLGVLFLIVTLILGGIVTWFLRTDFGMAMRAVGDNPAMITAQGVDKRHMIELGLALANGLVAFSGALIAQQQGFADVGMGVGTLVAGMAAVIMGETLLRKKRGIGRTVIVVALGAVLFRCLVALALRVGLTPIDLKLATAAFVLLALALPKLAGNKGAAS